MINHIDIGTIVEEQFQNVLITRFDRIVQWRFSIIVQNARVYTELNHLFGNAIRIVLACIQQHIASVFDWLIDSPCSFQQEFDEFIIAS